MGITHGLGWGPRRTPSGDRCRAATDAAFRALMLAALAFASAGCDEQPIVVPPPPEVGVASPVVRDIIRHAELSGRTEAVQVVEVRARVEGILLESLARPGALVTAGDVLFRIDPDQFIAERDAAAARVLRAEAELKVAEFKRERFKVAAAGGGANELEVLDAEATAAMAAADVEVARRELALRQLSVDHTEVRAPLTGEIEAGAPDLGSLVGRPGDGPLTRIFDTSRVHVWMTVPDRVFLSSAASGRQQPGTPIAYPIRVATEGDTGFPHEGLIDYVDPAVDPQTGTIRIRATIENPTGALKPGLFVRTRIAAGRIDGAVLLPEDAIGSGQAGRFVLVVGPDDVVESRPVTLGPREGRLRVIESGLGPGDRVVVRGVLRARPGQPAGAVSERIDDPAAETP